MNMNKDKNIALITDTPEDVVHLIKKHRKGILNLIFSRLIFFVLLIIFQLMLFGSLYIFMSEKIPYFITFQTVFSMGMVFYLFRCDMDSTAKLTWLSIITLFPVPGTFLLWYTHQGFGQKATRAITTRLINETKDKLPQNNDILADSDVRNSGTADLHKYLSRTGCFPVYGNTEVTYFPLGEDKFKAMLEELEKAEKFIFMEYFIIEEGYMWGKILSVLRRKAQQGVDIRVMYDGMCEISNLSFDYSQRLEKLGIKSRAFSPIMPFISTHYNYRDHRKILVIDGKVAFNGGVNLADEYINMKERFGHWKDTAVMLRGDAVQSFTLMFLQMWNIPVKAPEWDRYLDIPAHDIRSEGYVMPYADCPLDDDKVGESVYMDILNRAKDHVHIMTPYLILDGELETALKFAAERGIDVKIILPGIPDKKAAYALAKTHYKTLLKSGVKIYEYTPGFVHAKVCVADGEKAVIGTINFDYRSLYHHYECATYMYKTACIGAIEEDFANTLEKCREVTVESIKNEKLYYKVVGSIMKIIAPLM